VDDSVIFIKEGFAEMAGYLFVITNFKYDSSFLVTIPFNIYVFNNLQGGFLYLRLCPDVGNRAKF